MEGVHGVVLLAEDGKILFESLDKDHFVPEKSTSSWKMILDSIENFHALDLVFESGRFYIVKTESGILIISMSLTVSISMIKLNCDILIPELKKVQSSKGFKRFFGL